MGKQTKQTVPVSRRALIQRINRALGRKHQFEDSHGRMQPGQALRSFRGRARENCGEFYLLDLYFNTVLDYGVDLQVMAKKLKVLAPYEQLEEE